MPREIARRSPCNSASYSASLLETLNRIWNTYFNCSPLGEMSKTPTPPPSSLSEPSKYITQCSGTLWGAGIWFSRHSAKSTSACDLIAILGLKLISKAPSSTAYFEIRPVASLLWSISPMGSQLLLRSCTRRSNVETFWRWLEFHIEVSKLIDI